MDPVQDMLNAMEINDLKQRIQNLKNQVDNLTQQVVILGQDTAEALDKTRNQRTVPHGTETLFRDGIGILRGNQGVIQITYSEDYVYFTLNTHGIHNMFKQAKIPLRIVPNPSLHAPPHA
jgi:cell division septum initiation protein DivIVA